MAEKETVKTGASLDDALIDSRREIPFRIDLQGIIKAYEQIFHDAPMNAFRWAARKTDGFAQKMLMSGFAVVTMPLGIMLRNGARVAHEANKGRWYAPGISGVVGSLSAWYVVGGLLFGKLAGMSLVSGTVGNVGAIIGATVATSPIVVPAFTVGALAGSAALGAAAFAVSVFPAAVNIPRAALRTWDGLRGVRYSEEQLKKLETILDQESLEHDYQTENFYKVQNGLRYLSKENKEKIYKSLSEEFGSAVAAAEVAVKAQPAAEATVKAKPQGPAPV